MPLRLRPVRGTRTAASRGRLSLHAVSSYQRPLRGVHGHTPARFGPDRLGRTTLVPIFVDGSTGFCGDCGSSLFWEPASGERISIAAGTLDLPTGLETMAHVFVEDSGDYYTISDDLPRRADGNHGIVIPAD